jgi:predicted nucleic acid-binding protein
MGERRKRIDAAAIDAFLGLMRDLLIQTDQGTSFESVIVTARRDGLTAYDAAYLEVARRRDVPSATNDAKLRQAASEAGVAFIPIQG